MVPRDSAWFSVLDSQGQVVCLRDQAIYTQDWIGLRQLDEAGKLIMDDAPGMHMQLSLRWFEENGKRAERWSGEAVRWPSAGHEL